ncbi:hypothetical protein BpHYR1_002722 [Brachionus plicatilis]|uniref:Uncharacterized protein n=1 Tax=Brachionus plicatilis TaxID=10195 RepID=A0A3M7PJW2_BRAPC|nr:hypothetical protein BpHYR1_002722 [Brachionus plicatilis]
MSLGVEREHLPLAQERLTTRNRGRCVTPSIETGMPPVVFCVLNRNFYIFYTTLLLPIMISIDPIKIFFILFKNANNTCKNLDM